MHGAAPPDPPDDDRVAVALRGRGLTGTLVTVLIVAGSGLVAPLNGFVPLLWAWRSRTPLRRLGFVPPTNWLVTIVAGVVLGVTLKLVMKAVVMPLLGAPPNNQAYAFLQGNTAALPGMLLAVTLGAGFGEETVFRGFFFERLERILGVHRWTPVLIVGVTSLWFGVIHYPDQGVPGAQQAFVVGLVLGALFARKRVLWVPIIAHSAFDVTAVALIYWGLELQVARWLFP